MPHGDTELGSTKNDLIISLVQRELIKKAVVMPTVRDASAFAVKGAQSVALPRAGSFSVEDRATTAQASLVNVTYAVDTINMDRMATIGWVVDPQDGRHSAVDVEIDLAQRAARSHAADFDTQVIAGLEASSTATTTAGAITKDIFLEMRRSLLEAQANPDNLWFLYGPESEEDLLGISEFTESQIYGSPVIPEASLRRVYGVNLVMSTGITGTSFYMYDGDGYGFAMSKGLSMGERDAPEYGVGAKLSVMDQHWGHAQLQNGALLYKDNN